MKRTSCQSKVLDFSWSCLSSRFNVQVVPPCEGLRCMSHFHQHVSIARTYVVRRGARFHRMFLMTFAKQLEARCRSLRTEIAEIDSHQKITSHDSHHCLKTLNLCSLSSFMGAVGDRRVTEEVGSSHSIGYGRCAGSDKQGTQDVSVAMRQRV